MIAKRICFFCIWIGCGAFQVLAETLTVSPSATKENTNSPLLQPQLSVLGGNGTKRWFRYQNWGENDAGLSGTVQDTEVREVDLEIYGGRGYNIGVMGRFEVGNAKILDNKVLDSTTKSLTGSVSYFATNIGGFIRGQYRLTPHAGLFVKGEAGVGPYICGLAGVALSGVAQVGGEFYFTDWWGITAAYGVIGNYGIESIASQDESLRKAYGKRPLAFSSGGNLFLIGLKSTYL